MAAPISSMRVLDCGFVTGMVVTSYACNWSPAASRYTPSLFPVVPHQIAAGLAGHALLDDVDLEHRIAGELRVVLEVPLAGDEDLARGAIERDVGQADVGDPVLVQQLEVHALGAREVGPQHVDQEIDVGGE